MSIEQHMQAYVRKLVQALKDRHEDLGEFHFNIHASGRLDGDVKIEFTLDGNYEDQSVKGANMTAVIEEFSRRRDWRKRNDPKAISFVKPEIVDEIPF